MDQRVLTETLGDEAPSGFDMLENRVQVKLSGRIRSFQLLRLDTGIILRGFARTYHAKQLAQPAVMTECRLPIVANEIEVC